MSSRIFPPVDADRGTWALDSPHAPDGHEKQILHIVDRTSREQWSAIDAGRDHVIRLSDLLYWLGHLRIGKQRRLVQHEPIRPLAPRVCEVSCVGIESHATVPGARQVHGHVLAT